MISRGTKEFWSLYHALLARLIAKLRQKIEEVPGEPRHLLTVHTLGYRLEG